MAMRSREEIEAEVKKRLLKFGGKYGDTKAINWWFEVVKFNQSTLIIELLMDIRELLAPEIDEDDDEEIPKLRRGR
jgi:hypothetical protein